MNKKFWLYHEGHYHSDYDSLLDAWNFITDQKWIVNDCRIVNSHAELMKRAKVRAIALAT